MRTTKAHNLARAAFAAATALILSAEQMMAQDHPVAHKAPPANTVQGSKMVQLRKRDEAIIARGVPALGFVDHTLKGNARAIVYLNRRGEPNRLIVVQRAGFRDEVLDLAMELSMRWQREHLDDTTPVVLTLQPNGDYNAVSEKGTDAGKHQIQYVRRSAGEMMSPELLERANKATPIEIPGVGTVRLVPLK